MKPIWKRTLSLTLTLAVTVGALIPSANAMTIPAACDETYYATLDYYGGLMDSSVVKSIRTFGSPAW